MTTAEETAVVERHLAFCSECREAVTDVRAARGAEPEPMPEASLDRITKAVLAALEEEKRRGSFSGGASEPRATEAMDQVGTRDRKRACIAGVEAPNRVFARNAAREQRRRNGNRVRRYGILVAAVLAAPLLAWWGVGLVWNDSPTNAIAPPPAVANPPAASHTASGPGENARGSLTDAEPSMPTASGDVALDLPASFVDEEIRFYVAKADVEALLPHTDAEWEAWARQEFPHVMWVYDELKPDNPDLDWKRLLVDSGEIYRFDWPLRPEEPNVRPRLSSLVRVCELPGYTLEVVAMPRSGTGETLKAVGELALPIPKSDWVRGNSDTVLGAPNSDCEAQSAILLVRRDADPAGEDPFRRNRLIVFGDNLVGLEERSFLARTIANDADGDASERRCRFILLASVFIARHCREASLAQQYRAFSQRMLEVVSQAPLSCPSQQKYNSAWPPLVSIWRQGG